MKTYEELVKEAIETAHKKAAEKKAETSFEIGGKYYSRSICDHECIFAIEVIKRTAKTVTYNYEGRTRRSTIHHDENGEYIRPDNYSMAPVFRATRKSA